MLKIQSIMPRERLLIYISYKYKYSKILSFITIDDVSITKYDIPYLYKYPSHFDNFDIHPVLHLLVMSKLFGPVNEVDPHNKYIWSDLVLEKYWVTQCG